MNQHQYSELNDLLAVIDLQRHIAEPCSRDLLRSYLDNLKTLRDTTQYEWIKDMAQTSLLQGEEDYRFLVEADQEPSTSVLR